MFILSCQQFDNCSHCLPQVSFTLLANFCQGYRRQFATGVIDTGGIFTTGVYRRYGGLTPVANLPPLSTTLAKLVEKFAAAVVDTGGKFAAGMWQICHRCH
jgi:hypothetical protein